MNAGLFKNKYRIASARYKGWNYADDGFYFVTICTKNRKLFFGSVKDYEMELNDIGKLAERRWLEIAKHFDNVILDRHIIMPNHVHGILIIDNHTRRDVDTPGRDVDTPGRDVACNVSTDNDEINTTAKWYNGKYPQMSKISPKQKSLSAIIRSYKSAVTNKANQDFSEINFSWQTRFYDHIIKSEKAAEKIRKYIHDNPVRWEFDKNNSEDLWM